MFHHSFVIFQVYTNMEWMAQDLVHGKSILVQIMIIIDTKRLYVCWNMYSFVKQMLPKITDAVGYLLV